MLRAWRSIPEPPHSTRPRCSARSCFRAPSIVSFHPATLFWPGSGGYSARWSCRPAADPGWVSPAPRPLPSSPPRPSSSLGTRPSRPRSGLSAAVRFRSIARGLVVLRDVAYFLSFIVFFLYLNVETVENRRHR